MSAAVFHVEAAGPHLSIQDAGRPGYLRFGAPASGPMDRLAYAAANAALGNAPGMPAIEVSAGGLALACEAGSVSFAVAGGGFIVKHGGRAAGSWLTATIRAGERLVIRAGPWGSWTYLAFAGAMRAPRWLGSAATHALSGLGGGRVAAGQQIVIDEPARHAAREGVFACPVSARPRTLLHVVMGPQDRFFTPESIGVLLSSTYRLSDAYDRMGVRLRGPAITPRAPLDMPSEALARGAVQVSGDGMPTILLADHQTTGGYPKIATVVDADLDGLAQRRPHDSIAFTAITAEHALTRHRRLAAGARTYLAMLAGSANDR
jgi:allophanate hydrolase